MQEKKIILTNYSKEELKEMIEEVIQSRLSYIPLLKEKDEPDEELVTRQEAAKFYKTSLVSLTDWEKRGIIPRAIRKGSRVYFRKSELMNDIKKESNEQRKRRGA